MTDKPQKNKFKELRDEYFQQFDDLNEARPVLKGVDEAFTEFAQNILDEYKQEYLLLKKKDIIEKARENYKLDYKSGKLLPRTWRNWKKFFRREQNVAKTLLDEESEQETQQFFEECMKRLKEEKGTKHEEEDAGEAVSNVSALSSPPCGEVKSNVPGTSSPHAGENLPLTTLQAADELVKPIILKEEGPPIPKELAKYITDYFNAICPEDIPPMTQPRVLDKLVKEIAEKVIAEQERQTGEVGSAARAKCSPPCGEAKSNVPGTNSPQVGAPTSEELPEGPAETPQEGEADDAAQEPEEDAEEPEEGVQEEDGLGEDYGIDTQYEIIEEEESDDDVEGG